MANVSVGTVDRVIHNRGEVAPDSYKKVMDILEKTGYKPNLLARTLGSHKTFTIAALVPNPDQDEYWALSAEGIKEASEEWTQYGVQVIPFYFDLYDKSSFHERAQMALQSELHGMLIAPIFYQESIELTQACKKGNIPFVLFNNNLPEAGALSFIGQDLFQSGQVGAGLLHQKEKPSGTFTILHVYDDIHHSIHLYEKEKGFKDYFAKEAGENIRVKSVDLNYLLESTLEKKLNDLLADPELRGLLVTTSKGAFIVSKLLERHGKNGIKLVAYDLLKENVHYLNKGIIDFLINQNSKRQAFIGIGQLANHLLFQKEVMENIFFPLEIITKQNLQSYLHANIR